MRIGTFVARRKLLKLVSAINSMVRVETSAADVQNYGGAWHTVRDKNIEAEIARKKFKNDLRLKFFSTNKHKTATTV